MRQSIIHKVASELRVPPYLADYDGARLRFTWADARERTGDATRRRAQHRHNAVTRHASGPLRDRVAFRFLSGEDVRELTYGELEAASNRFANVLAGLGVGRSDVVFVLAGRIPELYLAVLGSLKNGTPVSPLFAAFGPDPIATRMNLGQGSVLVTTTTLYEKKVAKIRSRVPSLRHVLIVPDVDDDPIPPDTSDLTVLLAAASDCFDIVPHPARGPSAAPLHQRHHRHPQGCDARPPGRGHPLGDRTLRPRPPRRRHLLVHGRPRAG